MKDLIDIFFCLAIAILFRLFSSEQFRNRCLPVAFSYLLFWNGGAVIFCGMINVMLYYIGTLTYIASMGVVLSGCKISYFRSNGALSAFLIFLVYYSIVGIMGDGGKGELIIYHFRIFRMVIIGLIIGFWARETTNGFNKLLTVTTIAIFVLCLLYVKYSGWSSEIMADYGGRMVVDVESIRGEESRVRGVFNVNRFALLTTMLLPYPLLLVLNGAKGNRKKMIFAVAIVSCLVLTLVCIKTGSRNGGAGLVALIWYMVVAKSTVGQVKKMLLVVGMLLVLVMLIVKFMAGSDLRAFNFRTEKEYTLEEAGTGRVKNFLSEYAWLTDGEKMFGKGVIWYFSPLTGERFANNAHSIYFDIVLHSGWIGSLLFVLFCMSFIVSAHRSGSMKNVAILFWLVWMLTGLGEAANMAPSAGFAKYGLGIAFALCCKRRFVNDCFGCINSYSNRYMSQIA